MKLPSLLLDNQRYHDYLNGMEIEVDASLIQNKNVVQGDHIMVYIDSTASHTDVQPPSREKQSEYIGIEGEVTKVSTIRDRDENYETVQSLSIKKI